MSARPKRSFVADELPACPDGGDWSPLTSDAGDAARLERILHAIRAQGILMSTRGGWYYTSDDELGYAIVNAGANPLDCPCKQPRDGTGACDHIWAIRAVRGEALPHGDKRSSQ